MVVVKERKAVFLGEADHVLGGGCKVFWLGKGVLGGEEGRVLAKVLGTEIVKGLLVGVGGGLGGKGLGGALPLKVKPQLLGRGVDGVALVKGRHRGLLVLENGRVAKVSLERKEATGSGEEKEKNHHKTHG
jgi:hypothetical protein